MSIKELKKHVYNIKLLSYGHWYYTLDYRGKKHICTTNDSISIDRIREGEEWNKKGLRQAYQSLYENGIKYIKK